jgi:hypothetical protein
MDAEMRGAFAEISALFPSLTLRPYIVTMNVGVVTNFCAPSLEALQQSIDSSFPSPGRPFRNCIIVKMDSAVYGCNATCKVFVNGKMQISGCRSMATVERVAEDMALALHMFFKSDAAVLDYKIQMMNTSLRTGRPIKIEEAFEALRSPGPGVFVKYDKDHYNGIQVRWFFLFFCFFCSCLNFFGVFVLQIVKPLEEKKANGREMRCTNAGIFR